MPAFLPSSPSASCRASRRRLLRCSLSWCPRVVSPLPCLRREGYGSFGASGWAKMRSPPPQCRSRPMRLALLMAIKHRIHHVATACRPPRSIKNQGPIWSWRQPLRRHPNCFPEHPERFRRASFPRASEPCCLLPRQHHSPTHSSTFFRAVLQTDLRPNSSSSFVTKLRWLALHSAGFGLTAVGEHEPLERMPTWPLEVRPRDAHVRPPASPQPATHRA